MRHEVVEEIEKERERKRECERENLCVRCEYHYCLQEMVLRLNLKL